MLSQINFGAMADSQSKHVKNERSVTALTLLTLNEVIRMLQKICSFAFSSFAFVALGGASNAMAQGVVLHYNLRSPYVELKDGQLSGLTGTPALEAFQAAKIPFETKNTPAARLLLLVVKNNKGVDCGIGWFKNTERERFAKFTKPIYQDAPHAVLMAADNNKIKATDSLEAVLGNKELELLVKKSYSYGGGLDALIEKHQPKRQSVTVENIQMFKMIQAKRADYLFTSSEEAAAVIAAAGYKPSDFKLLKLAGVPPGELRYIMCSMAVPDELIEKVNAAIK